jgi:hypothetical protein
MTLKYVSHRKNELQYMSLILTDGSPDPNYLLPRHFSNLNSLMTTPPPRCCSLHNSYTIMTTVMDISEAAATMGKFKVSEADHSTARKEEVSSALAAHRAGVHRANKGMKKLPKAQSPKSKLLSRGRASAAAEAAAASTTPSYPTVPRTLQQETAFLRALGLTERPKYPVAGEMYQMEFSEFRNHVSNKLPLYDGRAVTTLGSSRKARNYKLVCALHPACPFLMQSKQQVYADGLAYQEIKEVVNHTCSVQSHAGTSLCSANFLGYLLREGQYILQGKGSGVDVCAQAEKKFGIDLESKARRQMFYKVAKAGNKQDDGSALTAFNLPSPIIVTQVPVYNLEPGAPIISNQLSAMECEGASTIAGLATATTASTPRAPVTASQLSSIERKGVSAIAGMATAPAESTPSAPVISSPLSSIDRKGVSTIAGLATASAESASRVSSVVPPAHTTSVAKYSQSKQSERMFE